MEGRKGVRLMYPDVPPSCHQCFTQSKISIKIARKTNSRKLRRFVIHGMRKHRTKFRNMPRPHACVFPSTVWSVKRNKCQSLV